MNFSNDFFNTIKRISYNRVASIMLDLNYNATPVAYDYIVTTDSNSIVGFLTPKKVNEIRENNKYYTVNNIRNLTHSDRNDKIFTRIGYDKTVNEYWFPEPGDIGTIINECISPETGRSYVLFKCNESGRLSVINKLAIVCTEPDLFSHSKNKIKIGRLVNNILNELGIEVTQKEIEDFVNLYKSSYDLMKNRDSQFKVVEGDEIATWYHMNKYECERSGTLANSCMAFKEADYFDLYTKNKNCKLLILFSDLGILKDGRYESNKISGRALVWNGRLSGSDGTIKEITLMDRVYTNNDSDTQLFVEYAKKMGWYYKSEQSRYIDTPITNGEETHHFYDNDENVFTSEFLIPLENYILDKYPYVDTFCYMKDNCLSNIINLGHDRNDFRSRQFRTTCGEFELIR